MAADLKERGLTPISIARNIYRADGLRGFFAGLAPCLLRSFPVNASALFVYEGILRLLDAEKVCCFPHYLSTRSNTLWTDSTLTYYMGCMSNCRL